LKSTSGHWKGAYSLFINHNGKREARRIGAGPPGQRAANCGDQGSYRMRISDT
jgi:hypothetical protein